MSSTGYFRRVGVLLLTNGLSKLLLVAGEILILRLSGASMLGLFAICEGVLLTVGTLCLLGTNFGLVQYMGIYQEDQQWRRLLRMVIASFLIGFAVAGICGLTLVLANHWFAASVFHEPKISLALLLVGCTLPFEAVNQAAGAAFQGMRRPHNYVIVTDLIRNALVVAVVVVSPWVRSDVTRLAATLLVGTAAQTVFGTLRLWPALLSRARRAKKARTDESASLRTECQILMRFSGILFIGNFAQQFASASVVLAGPFVSARELGIFSLFIRLLTALTFLQSLVNNTAPVEFARLYHIKDRAGLEQLYATVTMALMVSATLVSLPFLADPWSLLGLVSRVAAASAVLVIPLLVSQLINVSTGPIGNLLVACRHRAPLAIVSAVDLVLGLILFDVLGRRYGLAGVVAAETTTTLLTTALRLWFGWHLLRHQALSLQLWLFSTAITLAVLAGRGLDALVGSRLGFDPAMAVALPIGLAASAVVYAPQLRRYAVRRPGRWRRHSYEGKHFAPPMPRAPRHDVK